MNKKIKSLILFILSIISIGILFNTCIWYDIPWGKDIKDVSMEIQSSWDIVTDTTAFGFNILSVIKLILGGVLLVYIVYAWAQMIWSMWSDEDALTKSKTQMLYAIYAIIFINIPGVLYMTFHRNNHWTISDRGDSASYIAESNWNLFFDGWMFWYTFWEQIVWFMELAISAVAIIMLLYASLDLMRSRWREEKVTETKKKFLTWILALVFVWIIEAWKGFAYTLNVWKATNIFSELADLALFFAWPTAFFFLTIAAYYYITSWWDEEKVKKAKSIIINTLIATVILLAAYTFLADLATL